MNFKFYNILQGIVPLSSKFLKIFDSPFILYSNNNPNQESFETLFKRGKKVARYLSVEKKGGSPEREFHSPNAPFPIQLPKYLKTRSVPI